MTGGDAGGDVGDRETSLLLGDRGVELDLVEQIAELLDQVLVGVGPFGVEALDRVDDLIGLLDQERYEAAVGLFDVPRAPFAQRAHQLVETQVAGPGGDAQRRHVQRRQVVGLDRLVHLGPGRRDDPFVGGAEGLEQHDGGRVEAALRVVDRELDLGEHPVGVGVGDQQRARRPGGGGDELVTVDEPHPGFDGVDAEPAPGEVEERHRRQQPHGDAFVGEQRAHRSFEHQR